MYRTIDEEIFLAPETIISGVVAIATFADDTELFDIEPDERSRRAAAAGNVAEADTDTGDAEPDRHAPVTVGTGANPIDAWSRHARGASGFGG